MPAALVEEAHPPRFQWRARRHFGFCNARFLARKARGHQRSISQIHTAWQSPEIESCNIGRLMRDGVEGTWLTLGAPTVISRGALTLFRAIRAFSAQPTEFGCGASSLKFCHHGSCGFVCQYSQRARCHFKKPEVPLASSPVSVILTLGGGSARTVLGTFTQGYQCNRCSLGLFMIYKLVLQS